MMIKEFIEKELPELILSPLEGRFIIWIDFQNWHMTDQELQSYLEEELCIIADPGTIYKQSLCYRFNIATPRSNIKEFLSRLKKHQKLWSIHYYKENISYILTGNIEYIKIISY